MNWNSLNRLVVLFGIFAAVVISMYVFQASEANSVQWWGSVIVAWLLMAVLWLHRWYPKPSNGKPPNLLEMNTPQALDAIYKEMVNQYVNNKERFGFGVLIAVSLSGVGLVAAGFAQVLATAEAGSLFIVFGVGEIAFLWLIWTINDWRATMQKPINSQEHQSDADRQA